MRAINYTWLAFSIVATGTIMGTMDSSIVIISFPALTSVFQTNPSTVLWLIVAYNLIMTGTVLTLGRVADVMGRKRVYSSGFVVFTIGLALCSISQSITQLIIFRALQAAGSAMIGSSANAIITATFPSKEKGKALGLLEAGAGIGLMSGPALGGFMLDLFGWRSIFYLRLPIGILGSAAAWWLLKEEASSKAHYQFDPWGAGLLFGGLSSLLLAINQGEIRGWSSTFVLSFFIASFIMLGLFILVESRIKQPVVDLALFRHRLFATGNAMLLLFHLGTMMFFFLLPYYIISALGLTSTQAGLMLMTYPVMLLLFSPLSGWISDRVGQKPLMSIGLILYTAGILFLSQLNASSTSTDVIVRLVSTGLGAGFFTSPVYSTIMGSVPRERLGTASAMIPTMRNVGIATGMAIGGAIFDGRRAYHLSQLSSTCLPQFAEKQALVAGFHDTILVAAAVCFIAAAIAIFTRGRRSPEAVGKHP